MAVLTGYVGGLKNYELVHIDEVWLIVRSLKNEIKVTDKNGRQIPVYHVPALSPSPALFQKYLQWRDAGLWNSEQFEKEYVPQFLSDMHEKSAVDALNALYVNAQKKNILLLCFCKDFMICHRRIVLNLMEGASAEKGKVIPCMEVGMELESVSTDYRYYEAYQKPFTQNEFYLLVAGSRNFDDYGILCDGCDRVVHGPLSRGMKIVVIEGDARGADRLAARYAGERGFKLKAMPADWEHNGKSAGYIRNMEMHMAAAGVSGKNERACILFWDGTSRGTSHNFKLAKEYNTTLYAYNSMLGRYMDENEITAATPR